MIEIELDCNSDIVRVRKDEKEIFSFAFQYPNRLIPMFSEIFNGIDAMPDKNVCLGVQITEIDEDRKRTIEEW